MGPVTVRTATAGDAASIARLLAEGSLDEGAEDPEDPGAYAAAIGRIRASHGEVLVAEVDGSVVGVVEVMVLEHLQHRGARCCEIESLHVDAALRSRGIGACLLDAVERFATQRGCYRIQLTSRAVRTEAHRFYVANGFVASHVGFKRWLGHPGTP